MTTWLPDSCAVLTLSPHCCVHRRQPQFPWMLLSALTLSAQNQQACSFTLFNTKHMNTASLSYRCTGSVWIWGSCVSIRDNEFAANLRAILPEQGWTKEMAWESCVQGSVCMKKFDVFRIRGCVADMFMCRIDMFEFSSTSSFGAGANRWIYECMKAFALDVCLSVPYLLILISP